MSVEKQPNLASLISGSFWTFHVAADRIDKQLLGKIISAIINGEEDNEELNLKILNAINFDFWKEILRRQQKVCDGIFVSLYWYCLQYQGIKI